MLAEAVYFSRQMVVGRWAVFAVRDRQERTSRLCFEWEGIAMSAAAIQEIDARIELQFSGLTAGFVNAFVVHQSKLYF